MSSAAIGGCVGETGAFGSLSVAVNAPRSGPLNLSRPGLSNLGRDAEGRLPNICSTHSMRPWRSASFEVAFDAAGVEAYIFTFG
jgi:hypothetical protein